MISPKFTLQDVKYADSPEMFARAEKIYRDGKVRNTSKIGIDRGYQGIVEGSKSYNVWVSARRVDEGNCTCYMGQNDMLCKHMLALAIAILDASGKLKGTLPPTDLLKAKKFVNEGMKKVRTYHGPSRIWFSYQRTLATGAGIITEGVRGLSATPKNAQYLWSLVLRISNKLAIGGIDDSDGVIGDCVGNLVAQLGKYAKESPKLQKIILAYCKDDTGFGFENDLRSTLNS